MVYWTLALIFSEFARDNRDFYPGPRHVCPNLCFKWGLVHGGVVVRLILGLQGGK